MRAIPQVRAPIGWPKLAAIILAIPLWLALNWAIIRPFYAYPGGDWALMQAAASLTDPYTMGTYIYPPLMTWAIAAFLLPIGYPAFFGAHLVAIAFLRSRMRTLIALTSAPFWIDTLLGQFTTFYVVVGLAARRGSRPAALLFLAFVVLLPKIPFLPLAIWLAWMQPRVRLPLVAMVAVAISGNLVLGNVDEWLNTAIAFTGAPDFRHWDVGPTRFLGPAWLLAGLPLAAWLTFRGNLGWAGLAAAPYVPPPLLLLLVLELPERGSQRRTVAPASSSGRSQSRASQNADERDRDDEP